MTSIAGSSPSAGRPMELAEFLGKYSEILVALRRLALAASVLPELLSEHLTSDPFIVPLLVRNTQGADVVQSDLKALSARRREVKATRSELTAGLTSAITSAFAGQRSIGVRGGGAASFSGSHSQSETQATPVPAAAAPRWISGEIDDHDRDAPLAVGDTYTIAFGVDTAKRANAAGEAQFNDAAAFPDGVDEIELTVELQSDDFEITPQKPTFKLKRTGKGLTKARFDIVPKHEGRGTLIATIHKELNFVQRLSIELSVGVANAAPPTSTSFSRAPSNVPSLKARHALITMVPAIPNGYQLIVCDEQGSKLTRLEVSPDELSAAITDARDSLLTVVQRTNDDGIDVFQSGIDIPEAERPIALGIMAKAGARLFQVLFKHPGGSADASQVGAWLRDLKADADHPLSIQIISDRAPIPWPLLYLGDVSPKATLDWDNFLGMRHVIEQLPTVDRLGQGGSVIASDQPTLEVSINLNRKIDDDWRADFVASQEEFWANVAKGSRHVSVTSRTTSAEFLGALADETTADQLIYFYGHASTSTPSLKGGTGASSLGLTDASVTLTQLNTDASTDIKLRGNPLVFINACESAELSPLFYDGFVPYFMMKGARGVIGTECRTPGVFAARWAEAFFNCFLRGDPVGRTFLDLRREFLATHGNPLGLLYAVHCSSDTQIQPAL
jgi:hypothetical protein